MVNVVLFRIAKRFLQLKNITLWVDEMSFESYQYANYTKWNFFQKTGLYYDQHLTSFEIKK